MNHAFNNFMPHGHCFFWRPEILWPMVISDILTGVAYVTLTALLIAFARKRPDIPYRWIFWAFGAFILACGIGHFIDAWNVWNANYVIQASWRVVTCFVSLAVAGVGIAFFPKFLLAPSTVQLEEARARMIKLNKLIVYQNRFNKYIVDGVAGTREALVLEAIKALDQNDIPRLKEIFEVVKFGAMRFRLAMGDFLTHKNATSLSNTVMKVCNEFTLEDQNVRGGIILEHDANTISKALEELMLNAVVESDSLPIVTLRKADDSIILLIENKCDYTPNTEHMDIPYYTTGEIGAGLGFPYAKWVFLKHGADVNLIYDNKKLTVKIEFRNK